MDMQEKAFSYLDAHFDEAIALWKALAEHESPFWEKSSVDAACDFLAARCTEKGLLVRRCLCGTTGDGLIVGGSDSGADGGSVVLMAHLDTVHKRGAFGTPAFTETDGWLCGPGVGDCKGGAVMALYTLLSLRAAGYVQRPLRIIYVGNEEGGRPDCENFIPTELKGSGAMFNCETGARGTIVTSRKASVGATFTVRGQSGHVGHLTGTPASAIREAAYKIIDLEERSDYREYVFSCGEIAGGSIFTSVPDSCVFKVNCRIRTAAEIPRLRELLQNTADNCRVPGTSCTVQITGNIVPMSACAKNDALFERFSAASAALGYGALKAIHSGGGSDASYAVQLGIPVICATGVVTEGAHTLHERANIESLRERARIHMRTILALDR